MNAKVSSSVAVSPMDKVSSAAGVSSVSVDSEFSVFSDELLSVAEGVLSSPPLETEAKIAIAAISAGRMMRFFLNQGRSALASALAAAAFAFATLGSFSRGG